RELPNADLSRQRALVVVQEALARQIPEDALYLASSDMETFHGLERANGSRRFPLSRGVLGLEWYRASTMRELEPRLDGADLRPPDGARGTYSGIDAIVRWAQREGLEVVSTRRELLGAGAHGVRL